MLDSHDHLWYTLPYSCADVCVYAPEIYGSHMLQFNILMIKKERERERQRENYLRGTIPTRFILYT